MKRTAMDPKKDSKIFKSTADHIRSINIRPTSMRGGIRL